MDKSIPRCFTEDEKTYIYMTQCDRKRSQRNRQIFEIFKPGVFGSNAVGSEHLAILATPILDSGCLGFFSSLLFSGVVIWRNNIRGIADLGITSINHLQT